MDEMVDLLERDPRGRTWLSSFDFGIEKRHCPLDCEQDVLGHAYRLYLDSRAEGYSASQELAWKSLELAIADTPVRTPQRDPSARSVKPRKQGSFTHVTTAHALETYHFDRVPQAESETLAWHLNTDNTERLQILQELFESLVKQNKLIPKEKLRLGPVRCWVSKSPVNSHELTRASTASHLRDFLGLVHFKTGDFLVAYSLNPSSLPPTSRPAAIDGVGTRFRAWSDKPQRRGKWGTAVDLQKFAEGGKAINGAAEAVIPAFPIAAEALVEVRLLGHPGSDNGITERGKVVDHDDHVAFDIRIQNEARGLKVGYRRLLRRIRARGE